MISLRTACPSVAHVRMPGAVGLACGVLTLLAGCAADIDIRPGDVRTYRIARSTAPPKALRPAAATTASRIRYEPPPGWEDKGASGLRLATLGIGPRSTDEVTVIPASGTLESNVARWVGQLDETADETARTERAAAAIAAADTVDVDGVKATIVLLLDAAAESAAEGGQAILGAMIPMEGSSALFVKFKGDANLARRERENFSRFVASIGWK